MIIIEQIKAEIERLKVDYLNRSYTFVPTAMQQLLDFIDTLESASKCKGCNNVKGCVTCVNGDQWAHYKEPEKPNDQVVEGEVILNGHGLLVDVTKWGDGYKLKVIIKEN